MKIMVFFAPSELIRELLHAGHEVVAVNCVLPESLEESLQRRLNTFSIPGQRKLDWKAIKAVREAVIQFQPHVIHPFAPFPLAWATIATAWLPKSSILPKIVSFRGITRIPSRLDPANRITFFHPRIAAHACESEAVQESMCQAGIESSRCHVTYNCVAPRCFVGSRQSIREKWRVPMDAIVIGCVATIRPVKGIDILLEAAQRIEQPNVLFVIIGGGSDARVSHLLSSPSLQGRVVMPGVVHDAASCLHSFDVFVMPSRSEGLCRSLIEAMQAELPCIVSDAGGMKELIRHGVDGLVVPKESPDRLADAIRTLIVHEAQRRAMGQSAQQRAHDICNPNAVAARMLSIYNQVLDGA